MSFASSGGKIFTMLGLDNPRLCLKCSAEMFAEMIEREHVRPAPYVGRYKWIMLDRLDALPWNELQALIRQSYEMVSAKVPNAKRSEKTKRSEKANRSKSAPGRKSSRASSRKLRLRRSGKPH